MSEFYVFWRAQPTTNGVGSKTRFLRVVDELAAYPSVIAPVYDSGNDPRTDDDGEPSERVGFGFSVDGVDSPVDAHAWAESALKTSLHNALVGTPDIPGGGVPEESILLDDAPTIRRMAVD